MLKNNLAVKIAQKGVKQCDLANETKMSRQNLANLLNGKNPNPRINTIALMADVLGCTIDELIGRPIKDSNPKSIKITNHSLLLKIISFTFDQIKAHNHHTYSLDLFKTIMNIYSYSQEQNQIDKKFATWCIENQLLEKT